MEFRKLKTDFGYCSFLEGYKHLEKAEFMEKFKGLILRNENGKKQNIFANEKNLEIIAWQVFDDMNNISCDFNIENLEILETVSLGLEKCRRMGNSNTSVYIFPTCNPFVIEKIEGVSGYCPSQRDIILFINPINEFENPLRKTTIHEYAHTFSHKNHTWNTLLDDIIFEGLAEHFREDIIAGGRAKWSAAVDRYRCRRIGKNIESELGKNNEKLYYELFYNAGSYPLWAGYSLGYNIVNDFFVNTNKRNGYKNWKEVFAVKPKEILDISGFLK